MPASAVDLIRRKRDGGSLTAAEIRGFIAGYTAGEIPDYQAAALLMAVFFRGLSPAEQSALTDAMMRSGEVIDLSDLPGAKIDKHSTGGVGDKISLPLAPAVAACGVRVPMISGRGLGHSGGTLDKLESIPGFRADLSVSEFRAVLGRCGLSLIGQTERLVPADKRLYALRDVTGTVESIPLIAASIMSKKLAEGIDGLVLDVKVGSGAFMKTLPDARRLAERLIGIGRAEGKRVTAMITDMDQPLGRMVGNAAEVNDSLDVLRGRGEPDLLHLTRALGAEMLRLGGAVPEDDDGTEGTRRIDEAIRSGAALRRFAECARLQGATLDLAGADGEAWTRGNLHPVSHAVPAPRTGRVAAIDAEAVGRAGVALRAGRQRKEDRIDPAACIYIDRKRGEPVHAGEPLCRFGAARDLPESAREAARALLAGAYTIAEGDGEGGAGVAAAPGLILDVLR